MLAKIGTERTSRAFGSRLVELETLRQGSCVWRAGRNLGAGDGWRGRMNLGMRGWGVEGRNRQNVGSLLEGRQGTEQFGTRGCLWNCVELGCRNLADGPDAV